MPVFISHSHEDNALYSTLCLALDGQDIEHYDVTELVPGVSLANQLRDAIHKCEICIFLATKRSIQSQWCLAELGAFWGAGKQTIVYLSDPDLAEADIPRQFEGNFHARNAHELKNAVKNAQNVPQLNSKLLPDEYLLPLAHDSGHYLDHIRLACAHTLWAFRPEYANSVLINHLTDKRDIVVTHARCLLNTYSNNQKNNPFFNSDQHNITANPK